MKIVIGKLTNVSGRFYYFTTTDGDEFQIVWEGSDPLPPLERTIAMSIPNEPWEDGRYVVDNTGDYWTFADEPHPEISMEVFGLEGREKKYIALLWQKSPLKSRAEEQEAADKAAFEIERFYRKYSRDKWDVVVGAFVFENNLMPEPPGYGVREILQEISLGGYDPNYYHVRSYHRHSSYCGLGNIHGDKSATYDGSGNCGLHTYLHELGHNFGLHHANDEDGKEYYDKSDIMGMGPAINGINSPQMLKLGLYDDRSRVDLNDSSCQLMVPIELPWHALNPNETQHVVLRRDGMEALYASLRKDRGWPWSPREGENVLWIHRKTPEYKTEIVTKVTPASSPKLLPNGVTVTYNNYYDECAKIFFQWPNQSTPIEDKERHVRFAPRLPGSVPKETHSGLWHDPRFVGQGLHVMVKGSRIVVYWYTHTQWTSKFSTSERRWYFMEGYLGEENLSIYTTDGGSFDDPRTFNLINVGYGQISFFGPDSGSFRFYTADHGRGYMNLSPVSYAKRKYGLFYDQAKNGSGFTKQELDSGLAMYWFTYNQQGGQEWYMMLGGEDEMTVYQVTDGFFLDYKKINAKPVGKAALHGNSFAYTFDDGRSGEQNLTELF